MAEEFDQLPKNLRNISTRLVDNRDRRTFFICIIIILMSTAVTMSLILNTSEKFDNKSDTSILNLYDTDQSTILSDVLSPDVVKSQQEIILNLHLTATVHHNVTFNGFKLSENVDKEDCIECILKKIISPEVGNNSVRTKNDDNLQATGFNLTDVFNTSDVENCNSNNKSCEANLNRTELNKLSVPRRKRQLNVHNRIVDRDPSARNKNCTGNNCFPDETNDFQIKICTNNKNESCIGLQSDTTYKIIHFDRIKRQESNVNSTLIDEVVEATTINETFGLSDESGDCFNKNPEYVVYMWVLCLIALATALKLYYLIKTFLAIFMVITYTVLIINSSTDKFTKKYITADLFDM